MQLPPLRTAFLSGLLLLAPLGVTIFAIYFLVSKIGTPARDWFFPFLKDSAGTNAWIEVSLSLISVGIVFVLITLLGLASRFLIGRFALQWVETILTRLPLVSNIYTTVKQITDTFGKQRNEIFQKVVLVEFPRTGIYSVGFVTSKARGEIQDTTDATMVNVFIPTTPNPTNGFLVMVPQEATQSIKMTVVEAMKLIISGGTVTPESNSTASGANLKVTQPPLST